MSAKTLSVIYKEKIAEIPDAIDDAKEVANYHKEALKYAVEEMKGNVKGKAKGKSKKTASEKDENGEDKVKKPPTEYQVFVKEYQQVIKEKFPDLPSNQRFGKIAEEWKKRKEEKAGVAPAPAPAVVNNFMKVEEVSPPSTDNEEEPKKKSKLTPREKVALLKQLRMNVEEVSPPSTDKEEEPKEQPKSPSEEPDEEAVEEPQMPLKKNKKTLPPIKIPANKV
jgi:Zn-dependent metalloprotease